MKFDIKLILIFALISAVCCFFMLFGGKGSGTAAQIKLGDRIIRTVDLSDVREPYEFRVTTDDGGYNVIRVERGRIAVTDSDCPDKICVHQGYIQSGSLPVVCLPHRLTVVITGETEIDAVAGKR